MNSREFDGMLDDLVRQALHPFTDAEPPARVWRRVLRIVRSMYAELAAGIGNPASAGLPATAGLPAAFARWADFLSALKGTHVTYVPSFSNRSYYVESSGRGLPSPFWDITMKQMFEMRLTA